MSPGALVLVATPIGNLDDVSSRASAALAAADAIGCEDTRRTGRLLAHLGIAAPKLIVVNEHTERDVVPEVLDRLGRGERVVLVSDAGMPGISDPGEVLVRAAVEAGIGVEVVPGPSAAAAALVVSGLPTARFVFEGFLPRKGSARTRRLAAVATEERTIVLFEAPHRLARTLADLAAACGPDRRVVLARELTKLHEEVWSGTLDAAVPRVDASTPRGEWVVVVGPAPAVVAPPGEVEIRAALEAHLAGGCDRREAVAEVARGLRLPKREVYRIALSLNDPAS